MACLMGGASKGLHAVMAKAWRTIGHAPNESRMPCPDPSDRGSRRYSFEGRAMMRKQPRKHDRGEENDEPDEGYSE
jgi:hypothetical protein